MLIDGVNNKIVGRIDYEILDIDAKRTCFLVKCPRTTGYMQPTIFNPMGIQTRHIEIVRTYIRSHKGDFIKDIIAAGYDGTDYNARAVIKMGADKYKTIPTGKNGW